MYSSAAGRPYAARHLQLLRKRVTYVGTSTHRRLGGRSRWWDSELSRYYLRYDPSFLALQLLHLFLLIPAFLGDALQATGHFECLSWRLGSGECLLRGLQFAQERGFAARSADNTASATMSGRCSELSSAEIGLPGCTAFGIHVLVVRGRLRYLCLVRAARYSRAQWVVTQ